MFPSFPRFYSAYVSGTNAVVCGNFSLKACVYADRSHLFECKFRAAAPFASVACAMLYAVGLIAGRGIPPQVVQGVICWVTVVMTSLGSVWAWAYKCLQNHLMRPFRPGFVISPEQNERPSVTFYDGEFLSLAGNCIAKVSKIGNLVNAFIPNNGEPSFHAGNHTRLWGI